MSKFFRKSKKTFAVLLTIAFVLSIAAVPVFAGTTYSSLTVPVVQDDDDQLLGVFSIEVDPVVESPHEAVLTVGKELGDDWDITGITVARIVYEKGDVTETFGTGDSIGTGILKVSGLDFGALPAPTELEPDATEPGVIGTEITLDPALDSLILWLCTDALGEPDSVEIWLQLRADVDDTGNIRAFFENLQGQLVDGDVLIGRARAGELQVLVRDFTSFVDFGDVELRVTEDLAGTWDGGDEGDKLRLRLPRHFAWDNTGTDLSDYDGVIVFGDAELSDFAFTFGNNERDLFIEYKGTGSEQRIRFDFTIEIEVVDDERASKGDIVATTGGDYDVTPDQLIVGVFGDYDIEVFADDPPTVYAGQSGEEIANITIEEDVATTIIANRTVTFTLPDWAAWVEPDEDDEPSFDHRGVKLEYRDLRRDNRQMRFTVKEIGNRNDPASIELEDLEIMLNTNARGDVVVEIGGTAGVFGEVVVAEAVAAATIEVPEPTFIVRDARNQPLGNIYITEAKAGMFSDDGWLDVHLGTHMEWEAGYTVEVVEGDLEVGSAARRPGNQTLRIPISVESDEASTIRITGSSIAYMSALRGPSSVVLLRTSSAVVDDDVLLGADPAYYDEDPLHGFGTDIPHVGSATVTNIEVDPPAPAVVMMWIGSTTYTVDGEEATMDVAPFIENDRTFVPVRFIAEALGAEADWGPEDGLTEWVTLTKGDMVVTLTIGSNIITVVDGDETYTVMSDVAAQIVNDRTFLPARAVGEIFGAEFDWGPKDALTEWVSFTLP